VRSTGGARIGNVGDVGVQGEKLRFDYFWGKCQERGINRGGRLGGDPVDLLRRFLDRRENQRRRVKSIEKKRHRGGHKKGLLEKGRVRRPLLRAA